MKAHTLGPWLSHDINDDTEDCGMWVVDIPDDGEITVTRLYFGDMENNTGRDIGNADLVAAAPDLLVALEDVRNQFLNDADGPYVGWRGRMRDEVDAAIAKARGSR